MNSRVHSSPAPSWFVTTDGFHLLWLLSLLIKALIYYNNRESYNCCASLRRFSPYINSYSILFPSQIHQKTYKHIRQWLQKHRGPYDNGINGAEAKFFEEGAESVCVVAIMLAEIDQEQQSLTRNCGITANEHVFLIIMYMLSFVLETTLVTND